RSHCSKLRIGKCSNSIGYQPRIGTKREPISVCAPAESVTSGSARWIDFRFGLNRLVGSLIGADVDMRATIRSAKYELSSGLGTNCRSRARTIPYRSGTDASTSFGDPPRGHQNSSASLEITQS